MIKINGTKHARLDVVLYEEALLAHVQAPVDLDNGSIGVLGDYVTTGTTKEREVKALLKATATSTKNELVLVSAPELIYDETRKANNSLKNFYNEAGVATRAYFLKNIRKFRISEEGLDLTGLTGAIDLTSANTYYIVPTAGYKFAVSTTNTNAVGKIVRKDREGIPSYVDTTGNFTSNTYDMYVIEVL